MSRVRPPSPAPDFCPDLSSTDGLFPAVTLTYGAGARYPSGKGEVCKTFMRRFDSDPRLQNPFLRTPAMKTDSSPASLIRQIVNPPYRVLNSWGYGCTVTAELLRRKTSSDPRPAKR